MIATVSHTVGQVTKPVSGSAGVKAAKVAMRPGSPSYKGWVDTVIRPERGRSWRELSEVFLTEDGGTKRF